MSTFRSRSRPDKCREYVNLTNARQTNYVACKLARDPDRYEVLRLMRHYIAADMFRELVDLVNALTEE